MLSNMHGPSRTMLIDDDVEVFTCQCQEIKRILPALTPKIKQIQLLSSNAACCAAKMAHQGDVFQVLAQEIHLLGAEVTMCINEARLLNNDIGLLLSGMSDMNALWNHQFISLLRRFDLALSPISATAKKGEYLAIYSSVEAVHLAEDGIGFKAVAEQLKALMVELSKQCQRQTLLIQSMIEARQLSLRYF
jgi:hypothetical protein